MARQNIRYAELTVTPFSSTRRGIPEQAFMEAIEDARKAAEAELGRRAALVLRHPRRGGAGGRRGDRAARGRDLRPGGPRLASGSAARRSACPARSSSRTSTGPSPRACTPSRTPGRPPARETDLGRAAPTCAPSASATAPAPPRTRELLDHLAEHRIPLEVCPTSNIATRAVADLDEHPIKEMVDAGVLVTINSDDPPMFGTDLNNEYAVAARLLGPGRARASPRSRRTRWRRRSSTRPARRGSPPRSTRTRRLAARAPAGDEAVTMAPWPPRHRRGPPRRPVPCPREHPRLAALRARTRGADAVEIDVRLTRDGVPVLLHDATLKRLWEHDRPLDGLARRGAARTDRAAACPRCARRCSRAEDAPRSWSTCPAPTDGGPPDRRRGPRVRGRGAGVLLRGPPRPCSRVRAADPSAEIALTWTTLGAAPRRPARRGAAALAQLPLRPGDRELTDRVHRDGLLVSAWTADTRRTMRRLLAQGVDSITTNRIDALHGLLANSAVADPR